jgi:hypothetical protein
MTTKTNVSVHLSSGVVEAVVGAPVSGGDDSCGQCATRG